jgi:class 3 adenylate cyclase
MSDSTAPATSTVEKSLVLGPFHGAFGLRGGTGNVASRMEASGASGQVHVTEAVATQAAERFAFKRREQVEIRGRGPMTTYWLTGPLGTRAVEEKKALQPA